MKPQLALHLHKELDKKTPKCIGHRYAVLEKYDGWYGYWTPNDYIRSRAGRAIPSLFKLSDHLNSQHEAMPAILQKKGTFIFEILLEDVRDFTKLNGILNRTVGEYTAIGAYLMVHDYIEHEFNSSIVQENLIEFQNRHRRAQVAVENLGSSSLHIAPILEVSEDIASWRRCTQIIWDQGGEGTVLKRMEATYSFGKRNYDMLKIKEDVTVDLLVTGLVAGKRGSKYEHTTGALILTDKYNITHNVGGMTDEQRDSWWENPNLIVGKMVEIKAMKKLSDGAYREPRFKCIRHDKTPAEMD